LTITAYMLGVAVIPLIFAPLADALGRKPIMIWGAAAYVVVTCLCALAPTIETLLLGRVAQAAAAGTTMIASRAMIVDLFRGDMLSRVTSQIMLVFTIAPLIAPLFGAWVMQFTGWRGIFWFLAAYGVIAIFVILTLKETMPPERRKPVDIRAILAGYGLILSNRASFTYFQLTFWSAFFFFGMFAAAPFIFIDHFGMDELGFAWVFAAISAAAFPANYVNGAFVMRFGYWAMLRAGVWLVAGLALCFGVLAMTDLGGFWPVVSVLLVIMAAFHILLANTTAGMMETAADRAGAASATLASVRFIGGALGAAAVGAFGDVSIWPYSIVLTVSAIGHLAAIYGPWAKAARAARSEA
ncbi:MAG: MFS transporter, partial [Pseudomonadota bacterium]